MKVYCFNNLPYLLSAEKLNETKQAIMEHLTCEEDEICYPTKMELEDGGVITKYSHLLPDEVLAMAQKEDMYSAFERLTSEARKQNAKGIDSKVRITNVAPVPHRMCTVISHHGSRMKEGRMMLSLEAWMQLVELVMEKEDYGLDDLSALMSEKYQRMMSRYSFLSDSDFITIPLAEKIATNTVIQESVSDEICCHDDGNGNRHHLVASIEHDYIEIHQESIVDGEIEQQGSIIIEDKERFCRHAGAYLPSSLMKVLAKAGEDTDATLEGITNFLKRKRIKYTSKAE